MSATPTEARTISRDLRKPFILDFSRKSSTNPPKNTPAAGRWCGFLLIEGADDRSAVLWGGMIIASATIATDFSDCLIHVIDIGMRFAGAGAESRSPGARASGDCARLRVLQRGSNAGPDARAGPMMFDRFTGLYECSRHPGESSRTAIRGLIL